MWSGGYLVSVCIESWLSIKRPSPGRLIDAHKR